MRPLKGLLFWAVFLIYFLQCLKKLWSFLIMMLLKMILKWYSCLPSPALFSILQTPKTTIYLILFFFDLFELAIDSTSLPGNNTLLYCFTDFVNLLFVNLFFFLKNVVFRVDLMWVAISFFFSWLSLLKHKHSPLFKYLVSLPPPLFVDEFGSWRLKAAWLHCLLGFLI